MKHLRRLLILLPLMGFLAVSGLSQVKEFSLKEAQAYAVEHNYQTRNAVIDIAIANRFYKENLATGLPQASASISYNNFINLATQLIPAEFFGGEPGTYMEVQFGTKHNASAQAQLSQLLYNGAFFVGLKLARESQELSQLQLEQAQQEVRQAIANAYYLVLISERNLELMEETIKTMQSLLKDTRAMYEQGFMEETDVDKIRLLISDLETNRLMAANQIVSAEYLMKFNLGLSVQESIKLTDDLDYLLMEVDPEGAIMDAFDPKDHISYQLLDVQKNLTALQVNLARANYYPTVSAFLSQTQNAQRNAFNFFDFDEKWFPTSLAGVQINIPIFSSGQRYQQVQQAKLELDKVNNSKRQVTESLIMGALTTRNDFQVAVETHRNKKENYELARKIYNREQIRYKAGVSSSTDLNQSYNTLLEAQGTYLGAVLDLLNKKIEMDKAYNRL